MEETWGPGRNCRPATSNWRTLSHNVVSSTPHHELGLISQRKCVDRHWLHRYLIVNDKYGTFYIYIPAEISVKWWVTNVEQDLLTIAEHMSSSPNFSRVRVARSLVVCVMFCRSLFVLLTNVVLPLLFRFTVSESSSYNSSA